MMTKKDLEEFNEWLNSSTKMTLTEWLAREEDKDKELTVKPKRPRKRLLSEVEECILIGVIAVGFVILGIVVVAFIAEVS